MTSLDVMQIILWLSMPALGFWIGYKTRQHVERMRMLAILNKNFVPEGFPLDYYVNHAKVVDELLEGYLSPKEDGVEDGES